MALDITVQPQPCGALVRGIDLTQPLSDAQSAEVRAAWLQHQVLGVSRPAADGGRPRALRHHDRAVRPRPVL